jgi:hypothetical protein
MTIVNEPARAADIVYQDFTREFYIWVWCDHESQTYIIHKSINLNMDIAKFYINSRQEMREGLLLIEEEVNVAAMKPQWRRLKGEKEILNTFNLFRDDYVPVDDGNDIIIH